MAKVTITRNPITNNNTLTVFFTTDAPNITKVELTKDGVNYIKAVTFTPTSATFDVTNWGNGVYNNCSIRISYDDQGIYTADGDYTVNSSALYISEYSGSPNGDYTTVLQETVNKAVKEKKKIVFESGIYIISDTIQCPDDCIIEIEGSSDAFANSMSRTSRDMNGTTLWYEKPNNETLIIYTGVGTLFKHPGGTGKGTIFKFRNISFRNALGEGTNYILKGRVVGQTTVASSSKGKVYAENCLFSGFKVCFGDKYVTDDLETALSALDGRTKISKPTTLEKCCFVGSRCRFVACGCAVNLGVDARFVDCSFNNGWYGVVFQDNSGISTISNCRLEWLKLNGVYSTASHDITIIGNEFDKIGWAGVYFTNNTNPNICSNVFRRCGADTAYNHTAKTKNVHIYVDSCTGGVINSNVTVKKDISDSGGGTVRPSNSMCIRNNKFIVVTGNNFSGCTTGNNNDLTNNTNSILANNITAILS